MYYRSNKTYDLLDARHELNVYDDLENPIGLYNLMFFCAKVHKNKDEV